MTKKQSRAPSVETFRIVSRPQHDPFGGWAPEQKRAEYYGAPLIELEALGPDNISLARAQMLAPETSQDYDLPLAQALVDLVEAGHYTLPRMVRMGGRHYFKDGFIEPLQAYIRSRENFVPDIDTPDAALDYKQYETAIARRILRDLAEKPPSPPNP